MSPASIRVDGGNIHASWSGGKSGTDGSVRQTSRPFVSFATTAFSSAVPIRFGEYAVRYALEPHLRASPGEKPPEDPNGFQRDMRRRLATGPVVFDFRIQFFIDER